MGFIDRLMFLLGYEKPVKTTCAPTGNKNKTDSIDTDNIIKDDNYTIYNSSIHMSISSEQDDNEYPSVEDKTDCISDEDINIIEHLDSCREFLDEFGPYNDLISIHEDISKLVVDNSNTIKNCLPKEDMIDKILDSCNSLIKSYINLYASTSDNQQLNMIARENPECLTIVRRISYVDLQSLSVRDLIILNKFIQMQIKCNEMATRCNKLLIDASVLSIGGNK